LYSLFGFFLLHQLKGCHYVSIAGAPVRDFRTDGPNLLLAELAAPELHTTTLDDYFSQSKVATRITHTAVIKELMMM
jgi:hypothetical protein